MAGIEELKDVVKAAISIGEALSDGIGLEDLGALLDLPAAIDGISEVPEELSDLDETERAELQAFIQSEFDIPDDQVEEFIEQAIIWAFSTYELYLKFKSLGEEEEPVP